MVFFIFRPFLSALVLAISFAVVFDPLYQRLLKYTRRRRGLAAFLTTFAVIILVVAPLVFLGTEIYRQAQQVFFSLAKGNGTDNFLNIVESFLNNLRRVFPVSQEFSIDLDQYVEQGLDWLLQNIGAIFSNAAKMIISFFVFFIALYYLMKDGHRLKDAVVALSPLADTEDEMIFKKLELAVSSVIKGSLVIALIQGASASVGFLIFGVPNAVLWGSAAAIAGLLPGVGTALVLTPAIIFLFLIDKTFSALGLLVWGATAVGLIDNFLGPVLVGRAAQLHPLLVFLSVLGGIGFFGPFGFLLGPLALNFLFALLDIYSNLLRKK